MTFNPLNYYEKIGRVAHQMNDTMQRLKESKSVRTIGIPVELTPQELLNFQKERIRILDVASKQTEQTIRIWITKATGRLTGNERKDFEVISEIALLNLGFNDDKGESKSG